MTGLTEVADRVWVLRHPVLDVNATLIVGAGEALLVDTLSTPAQAAALAEEIHRVAPWPGRIVNTHHHFDHCFGNATLAGSPPCPVYAHENAAGALRRPEEARRAAYAEMADAEPALAAELADVDLLAPTRTVQTETLLDVGGRAVLLRHPGRGHTAGDLVVHVPDADVLVAGDLVESSGPPAFEESYPLAWPESLADVLRLVGDGTVVIPGHGAPTDRGFVVQQHRQLSDLAWLIRAAHTGGATAERVAAEAPFGARAALIAARRGFAELDGTA